MRPARSRARRRCSPRRGSSRSSSRSCAARSRSSPARAGEWPLRRRASSVRPRRAPGRWPRRPSSARLHRPRPWPRGPDCRAGPARRSPWSPRSSDRARSLLPGVDEAPNGDAAAHVRLDDFGDVGRRDAHVPDALGVDDDRRALEAGPEAARLGVTATLPQSSGCAPTPSCSAVRSSADAARAARRLAGRGRSFAHTKKCRSTLGTGPPVPC